MYTNIHRLVFWGLQITPLSTFNFRNSLIIIAHYKFVFIFFRLHVNEHHESYLNPLCKLPCLIHTCPKIATVNIPLTRDIGRQIGQTKKHYE